VSAHVESENTTVTPLLTVALWTTIITCVPLGCGIGIGLQQQIINHILMKFHTLCQMYFLCESSPPKCDCLGRIEYQLAKYMS
jgi:hypothetical protein